MSAFSFTVNRKLCFFWNFESLMAVNFTSDHVFEWHGICIMYTMHIFEYYSNSLVHSNQMAERWWGNCSEPSPFFSVPYEWKRALGGMRSLVFDSPEKERRESPRPEEGYYNLYLAAVAFPFQVQRNALAEELIKRSLHRQRRCQPVAPHLCSCKSAVERQPSL